MAARAHAAPSAGPTVDRATLLLMATEHKPVLAKELVELLAPEPGQTAIDCTFGGGGHARLVAEAIGPSGTLVCIDRDPAAEARFEAFAAEAPCSTRFLGVELSAVAPERDLEEAGGRARREPILEAPARPVPEDQDPALARRGAHRPQVGVETGGAGRDERRPRTMSEQRPVRVEDGGRLGDEAAVLPRIGVVGPEDVVPENESGAVEEAVDDVFAA